MMFVEEDSTLSSGLMSCLNRRRISLFPELNQPGPLLKKLLLLMNSLIIILLSVFSLSLNVPDSNADAVYGNDDTITFVFSENTNEPFGSNQPSGRRET